MYKHLSDVANRAHRRMAESKRQAIEDKRAAENQRIAGKIGISLRPGESPKAAVERRLEQARESGRQQLASEIGISLRPGETPKAAVERRLEQSRESGRQQLASEIGIDLAGGESPKAAFEKNVALRTARAIASAGHEPLDVPSDEDGMDLEELREALAVEKNPVASKRLYSRIQKLQAKRKASPGTDD